MGKLIIEQSLLQNRLSTKCRELKTVQRLKEYLSVLIENNLLEYLEGSHVYKTNEKGLNLLKMHNEIGELLQTSVKEPIIQ
jgi:predicted transcriptional regulator